MSKMRKTTWRTISKWANYQQCLRGNSQRHGPFSAISLNRATLYTNAIFKTTHTWSGLWTFLRFLSLPPPLSLSPFMSFLVTASDGWEFFFFVLCVQFHSIGQTGFLFQEIASAHYKALHLHSISMFTNALHIFLEHVTDERQHVFWRIGQKQYKKQ